MGKYVAYVIGILIVLFALEWFGIVDVPFLEIPNYLSGKEEFRILSSYNGKEPGHILDGFGRTPLCKYNLLPGAVENEIKDVGHLLEHLPYRASFGYQIKTDVGGDTFCFYLKTEKSVGRREDFFELDVAQGYMNGLFELLDKLGLIRGIKW